MTQVMNPVRENRAYVKGNGHCVNVDNTAYRTRLAKIKANKRKDQEIATLSEQVATLTALVEQLVKANNGDLSGNK